jgi:hypothetical protein
MPLATTALATTLKQVFRDAKDEQWSSDQVADALAAAFESFVKTGDVVGVTVDVRDSGNNPLGTGTQTGAGTIE